MNISKIQILGPFNTGTNLLAKILKKNIQQKIQIHHEGHTLCWKHTLDKSLIEEKIKQNPDTLFICVYKPLHNWVCSMQKSSYDIKWDKTLSGKCKFNANEKLPGGIFNRNYSNIVEIYNMYYNMYIQLINDHKRVIFMNYYDIIVKENVVKYITNKLSVFNLSIKGKHDIFNILNKPSKGHGRPVKSANAAINKADKCYNDINNCEKNKLLIKKWFNYEIKDYFEH